MNPITIVVDTLRIEGQTIHSIYHLDALVEASRRLGFEGVAIKEPSAEILQQINNSRPNYNLIFKVV
jgi:hypothetical protein